MGYSWISIISMSLNMVLGGQWLINFFTVKSQKKKSAAEAKSAEANAESTELSNVSKVITNWREEAEYFKKELIEARSNYAEVVNMVNKLQKSVNQMNRVNGKILKLLEKISHENLESTVEEIKQEITKGDA